MEWQINVAKIGRGNGIYKDVDVYVHHFKAVCSSFPQACIVYKELKERYPAPKYQVTMYKVEKKFTTVDESDIKSLFTEF